MTNYEQLRAKFMESGVSFSVGIREEFAEAGNLPDAAHTMIQVNSPITFWFTVSGEYVGAHLPYEAHLFRWESRLSYKEKPYQELTTQQAVSTRRIGDYIFPFVKRDTPTDAEYTQDDWILDKDDNACS